jgi:hypothetical protein
MQSTTSQKLSEDSFWWPSPEAFEVLEVSDIEDGWQLSAPDDTELAEWLNYWNQDEDHHAIFQTIFVRALTEHANFVLDDLEQHGKTEITDGSQSNPEQAENERTGSVA